MDRQIIDSIILGSFTDGSKFHPHLLSDALRSPRVLKAALEKPAHVAALVGEALEEIADRHLPQVTSALFETSVMELVKILAPKDFISMTKPVDTRVAHVLTR